MDKPLTQDQFKNSFAEALAAAQGEIHHALLDSKNPHFKSEYASLEEHINQVKPALAKHGLSLVQGVEADQDGKLWLITRLMHKDGTLNTSIPLILSKNDMQGLGSAITYARRYTLAAMFNMGSDDDDGEVAVGRGPENPKSIPPAQGSQAALESTIINNPEQGGPKQVRPPNKALGSQTIQAGPLSKYPSLAKTPVNEAAKWIESIDAWIKKHPSEALTPQQIETLKLVKDYFGW